MRPYQFKELGDELISLEFSLSRKLGSGEPIYRTSIGRFYYYVFLELRETLKVNLPKDLKLYLSEESGLNHHCILQETLKELSFILSDKDIRKAYESLKSLRKSRNTSDYDMIVSVDKSKVTYAKVDIKRIEKVISRIPYIDRNSLSAAFQQALESCKKACKSSL